jgi:uncharacterized glyoxalase superfamily protein PhnB
MLEIDAGCPDLRGDFLRRVFEAAERIRLHVELGTAAQFQCELWIGDSVVRIAQSAEGPPPCPLLGHLIVRDSDAMFARAVEVGASAVVPIDDTRSGRRGRRLIDPFGNGWIILTSVEARSGREQDQLEMCMHSAPLAPALAAPLPVPGASET